MGDARQYQKEFDNLMSPLEEKAERANREGAKQFVESLIARGRAVGLSFGQIAERFQADDSFDGILKEIESREDKQESK